MREMNRRTLATTLLLFAAAVWATPALAYVDRETDTAEGDSIDILATSRRVKATDHGRVLVLKIFFEAYADAYTFDVKLDSRGGTKADAVMVLDDSGRG
jgi:hypothetical protein